MYIDESGGTDETVTTEEMTVTVDGEEYEAELNFDLDADGVNDTTVIHEDGGARAFVDSDADGDADQYVELDAEAHVVAEADYDATSGDWVAADSDAPDGPAPTMDDVAWGGEPVRQIVEGVARIDSATGLWISQN